MSAQHVPMDQNNTHLHTLERQSMLSQRIVLFLYAAAQGDQKAFEEAQVAYNHFTYNHQNLCQHDPQLPGREAMEGFIQVVHQASQSLGNVSWSQRLTHEDLLLMSGGILQVLDHAIHAYRQRDMQQASQPRVYEAFLEPSSEITETLTKVVFEFKLLAVNARIIAAHAGLHDEAVDAFGAVCDQMNNLAEEIARIINQLLKPF